MAGNKRRVQALITLGGCLNGASPQAAIIASRHRMDSGKGIEYPIMYQDGISWIIPGPTIDGNEKTSIYF
jgi:hypothetical protein